MRVGALVAAVAMAACAGPGKSVKPAPVGPVVAPAPEPAPKAVEPTPEPAPEPKPKLPVVVKQPPQPAGDPTVTILMVGDTGLNRSRQRVSEKGVVWGAGHQPWSDTTENIKKHIDGDVNFMNMETVVSDRNDLKPDLKGQKKGYNFMTHPAGARHLIKIGFNLVSMANNHSMDFGLEGLKDSLKFMKTMHKDGLIAHAGIGMNREEASRPQVFTKKGHQLAFSAVGIVTRMLGRHRCGKNKPGQISYRYRDDFLHATKRLTESVAAYRMMSIHYGLERKVRADWRQLKDFRGHAVKKAGVDLIIGHHAHVVRPIEITDGKVIFYGLGNFLHRGTRNMGGVYKFRLCRDYGIIAKVHLQPNSSKKLEARAIEVLPVTNMHLRTKTYTDVAQAHKRIHVMNYLAKMVDNEKTNSRGVRFTPQKNGSGLYCFPGADKARGKVGKMCQGWTAAEEPPAALARKIRHACRVLSEKKDDKKDDKAKKGKKGKRAKKDKKRRGKKEARKRKRDKKKSKARKRKR